jgi:hypothetical protein
MITQTFQQNLDSWQLITKAGDGGDTCSRHFTALYCSKHTTKEVMHALSLLQVDGIPRRHPDTSKWYHRTNTTSRDQLIPYLAFTATPHSSHPSIVRDSFMRLVAQHARKLFLFTWNTKRNFRYPTPEEHAAKSTPDVPFDYSDKTPDFCGPNVWAIYLRGLMHYKCNKIAQWAAYPILHILDLHKFADICLLYVSLGLGKKIGPTHQKWSIDHDMQNSTLCVHYCYKNFPTFISWITWKLLKPQAIKAAESFFQQPDEPRLDIVIRQLD